MHDSRNAYTNFGNLYMDNWVAITLTEHKKCAKYNSARLLYFSTINYADNMKYVRVCRLWNTTTMKVRRGTHVLHLTLIVE